MKHETLIEDLNIAAAELADKQDTEWADDHADVYEDFAATIERLYDAGKITAAEFNKLALTAFYDYQGDLKDEEVQ